MKFGNKFWLILFEEYISPKLFAVLSRSSDSLTLTQEYDEGIERVSVAETKD